MVNLWRWVSRKDKLRSSRRSFAPRGCKKKATHGHPRAAQIACAEASSGVRPRATTAALSPRHPVNSPDSSPAAAERMSLARVAAWLLVAVVVVAGVVFYFRHDPSVAPLLDSVHQP